MRILNMWDDENVDYNLRGVLQDLCSYYKRKPLLIEFMLGGSIPMIQFDAKKPASKGIRNILANLVDYEGQHALRCAVEGWAEFCVTKLAVILEPNCPKATLEEVNRLLRNRVYLVGHKLSAADVLVYLFLYDLMLDMRPHEKIRYGHISRWFDHIQREPNIRTDNMRMIPFDLAGLSG